MAPKRGKQLARGPKAARLRAAAGLITTRDFSSTSLPGVSSQGNNTPSTSSMQGFSQNCSLTLTGFTMRDEARNTAFHQSSWGQDARLRQKPVTFISGGFTEPLKDTKEMDDPDIRMLENPVNEQNTDPGPFNSGQIPTDARQLETGIPGPVSLVENEYEVPRSGLGIRVDDEPKIDIDTEPVVSGCDSRPSPPLGFFFDLEGDKSLRHVGPRVPVPVRASSPARSDSSEEVILFKGRSGVAHRSVLPQKSQWQFTSFAEGSRNESPLPLDGVIHSGETIAPSKSLKRLSGPEPAHLDPPPFAEDEEDEEDEGDAILADYIANIVAQGDNSESPPNGMFSTGRDLGGDHHAFGFGLEDDDGPEVGRSPDNDSDGGSSTGNDNQHNRDDNGDASDSESGSVIDDESMARLLAKQDELGMGTDMLLLNDGTFGTSKPRRRGGSSPRISPPNMGSVADDFEGLDLTDWNQPDFRKPARSRRSKQPPTFNVSDSELEVALRSAWQTDRERKKKRKLERELLRSEGLLGKNIDPDDPRVKYQSHMVLDDIKSEVVSFLLSAAET